MKTLNTYMDRAWNDLATDDDWWKATLVLGLMNCVPIIGQIIMFGYLFDWAKEAAWGMHTPLSRKLGDLGRCARYGFLALWVMLIWVAPVVIIGLLLGLVPVVGSILRFLVELFAVFVAALAAAGAFRSVIYERVLPGLQVKRVFMMFRRDPGGFGQAFCVILLVIPLLAAALFIVLLPTIPFINVIASVATTAVLGTDLVPLALLGVITIVVALIVWIAGALVSAFISALYMRSLGYWMEQFRPDTWRSPSAPMPFEVEMAAEKEARREAKAAAKAAKKKHAKPEAPAGDAENAEQQATTQAEVTERIEDATPDGDAAPDDDAGQERQ
ncbi:MAG: DUF4013 domain-containing protein [Coriobacteriales bacterium]